MKMLELMAGLGLWPFDASERDVESANGQPNGDSLRDQRIVVPEDLRPVMLHPARWPESQRRFH